jgi:tetratricopeptide (TPR) repeat protein
MLTTKNRVALGQAGLLIVSIALCLSGCTPAGPRALLEGERLLKEGKVEQAVQRLERAVRVIPGNAQAWNHLGLAYHRAGRLEQATQAYQQALVLDRELAPARFNLGCLDLERGDAEGAIRELSAYLAGQPGSTAGWLKLGTAQLRARQAESAEQSFRQALQLDERLPEALNGLGLVQTQRRRYPEAYQHFQAATRLQPDYAPALRNAAVVAHQFLKNRSVALQRYRDLLALTDGPDREAIEALIGGIEEELKPAPKPARPPTQIAQATKPAAAARAEDKASPARTEPPPTRPVPAEPSTTNTASPATIAATTNASPQPSVPAPTKLAPPVVVPEPDRAPEERQERQVQARNGERQSVERPAVVSEPAVDALSPFPRYRYQALVTLRKGDRAAADRAFAEGYRAHTRYRFSEAVGAYQRAIQSDPSYFDAHYNLGLAAYENGDLPLALSAYETALAIDPESLKARFNFASTLEQAGYPRDAADELEKLVIRHSTEVRIHAALANLYARKLGDPKRARQHYLRVLELDPRHRDATAIRYWLEDNR